MDAHSFTVGADYRIYSATTTGFSGGAADTLSDVIASDDRTVLEASEEGGAIRSPSSIARTVLPTTATCCYVRVRQATITSLRGPIRPYDFYVRVLSGSPGPETEPNEGVPPAPRSNGWRGRVIGPATAKTGCFAITVNGRDTIGVIVAVDLERGAPVWDVIEGGGMFTGSFILIL